MVQKVQISDASDAQAAKDLAKHHNNSSPEGSTGWTPKVDARESFSGKVQFDGKGDGALSHSHGEGHASTGKLATHSATEVRDGLADIGGMTVNVEVAKAEGWLVEDEEGNLTVTDPEIIEHLKEHQAQEAEQELEKKSEQEVFDAHNEALDQMEAELGHEGVLEVSNEAVATGDIPEGIPQAVIDGYTHQAVNLAAAAGCQNLDLMKMSLTDEQQQQARFALVTGDQSTFSRLAGLAVEQASNLASEDWFRSEISEAGGQVVGSGANAVLIYEGQNYLLADALRRGMITFD